MTKVFAVHCPECKAETPLSTKRKEVLSEMKAECSKCGWLGMASEAIVQEKEFEDWF